MKHILKLGERSLLIILCLSGCRNYDKDIQRIDNRIDRIDNTQINSLNQQIDAVKKSLPQLQKTDAELKTYIEKLEGTSSDLQKSINEAEVKIDKVKSELDKAINDAKADVISQLNAATVEMKGQLGRIEETIKELRNKDEELEKRITGLETFVEGDIQKTKDWVAATFATLEQYNVVTTDITTIKQSIESLNDSVEALETKFKDSVSKELEAAISQVKEQLSTEIVEEVTNLYTAAISAAKTELTNAYKMEIAESLSSLEESMKEWVNSVLTGYYTIAETEAKLVSLKTDLENQLKSQKEYLEGLVTALRGSLSEKIESNASLIQDLGSDLNAAQTDIAKNAQRIVDNASKISSNSQKIDNNTKSITENSTAIENVEKAIVELKRDYDGKISALESKLTQVEIDVSAINEEIASIRNTYSERISNLQKVIEGKIAENKEAINANKTAVSENAKLIASNRASIDAMKTSTETSASSFAAQILSNAEKISRNAEMISESASLIADNAKAIGNNASAIAENTTKISALEKSISGLKSEITESYEIAITSAISECEGRLKGNVAKEVSELNTRIDTEIGKMLDEMEKLTERIKTLEHDIADIKTRISNMGERIDDLQGRVSTIEQQVVAVKEAIGRLTTVDSELKSYIETLQVTSDELKNTIAASDSKIKDVQNALQQAITDVKANDGALRDELVASIEAAKSETLSQLESMKDEMASKLKSINSTIVELKAKDNEIVEKIEDLNAYIDGQIQNCKDWATATFATLAQYEKVAADVASLKQNAVSLTETLSGMEAKLKKQWTADIESAIAPVKEKIGKIVEEIRDGYTSAIATTKGEIEAAYRSEMASSIALLETSLKSWVSNSLSAYSTIAETEAKLDAQKKELESQLSSHKVYLEEMISNLESSSSEKIQANADLIGSLKSDLVAVEKAQESNASGIASLKAELAKSKDEVTSAYTSAISEAINILDGKLTASINDRITEANKRIDNEIVAIDQKLSAMDGRVKVLEDEIKYVKSELKSMQDDIAALKEQISNIVNKVISISHVPTYEDGGEEITYMYEGTRIIPIDFTVRFEVAPASAAEEVASIWRTAVSARGVYTKRMTKAAGDFVPLVVKSVTADEGILSVIISGQGISETCFGSVSESISVRLKLSCGTAEVLSDYFKLYPKQITNNELKYFDSEGVYLGQGVKIDGVVWAPVNVGSLDGKEYGKLYDFSEAQDKCPSGWRLPTKSELMSLRENSKVASYDGIAGMDFYGRTDSSFGGEKIFFPAAGQYTLGSLADQGNCGYYWSSDEVAQSSPSSAYGLYFSKSGSSGSMASAVSTKNSVRCVKEQSLSANDYVDKSGVNWGASTKIGDVYWAPVNCGATGDNLYGSYYYFNQINTACPSGWRIPTLSEFDALSKNYSGLTSLRNIRGRWFSGPIAYSEDVAAVFLPAAGGDGKNLGTKGVYWTSSIGEDPDYHFEYSRCFEFSDSGVTSSYTPVSSSSKNTYSVRCVKK